MQNVAKKGGLTDWKQIKNAWEQFKKGKNKKLDVVEFSENLKSNLNAIQKELKSRTYVHQSYSVFYVQDPKLRKIHKACVRDRVVHHLLFNWLYEIFDRAFIFDSYSCRIGKGTHRAVRRLHYFFAKVSGNNMRNIWVLKCDIKKFFENIDQSILTELLERRIKDKHILWLTREIIGSFKTGLPLGNITSQLFANVYLNELDQFIKQALKIRYYIRYCDDFIILHSDKNYLESLIPVVNNFLSSHLKLSLHPNKIILRNYRQGIDFLGYVSFPYCKALRPKTKKRMFEKINTKNKSSYLGMLKHCNGYNLRRELLNLLGFAVTIKE